VTDADHDRCAAAPFPKRRSEELPVLLDPAFAARARSRCAPVSLAGAGLRLGSSQDAGGAHPNVLPLGPFFLDESIAVGFFAALVPSHRRVPFDEDTQSAQASEADGHYL